MIDIIRKRADKYNFAEIAGEFYRDSDSKLIKRLNEENKKVYFGLENYNGIYTVIGDEHLYFSNNLGTDESISNIEFLEIAKISLQESGKEFKHEFIKVDKRNFVWILNIKMLSAISSLILFLTRTDGYGIKPKSI